MAIKDWPAGFITKDQVVPAGNYEDSAASGIWTLDQVANYVKQNLWPTAGNVLSLHYIAQVDGTYKTDLKYFNFGTSGNILYGQPNEQTSKYVIEMTSDGTTVNAEIQYTGGSGSYEEYDSKSWDFASGYIYMPTMNSNRAGAMRVYNGGGSTSFSTSSAHVRANQTASDFQYGGGGTYYLGTPGVNETIAISGFGPNNTASMGYWSVSNSNFRSYLITPSGSSRTYNYTGSRSNYSNRLSMRSIGNNPSQYRKHTSFWQTSGADTDIAGVSGKYNNSTNTYSMAMGWGGVRWLELFLDNDNGCYCLISWDYNAYVKDQLVLRDSVLANTSVKIISYMYAPASVGGDSSDNDVYCLIKDPASSRPRTYYYVLWRKDDNNNANNGGSGNSGGTWNQGQNAKRIVLNSTYGSNGTNGVYEGSFSSQGGIDSILFSARIGSDSSGNSRDVIFQFPLDISSISDGTYGPYTIDSGAAVNTIVNAYQQQSLGTSFSNDGWSYSKQATSQNSITPGASTFTSNAALSEIETV